jgi:hypothetical protein
MLSEDKCRFQSIADAVAGKQAVWRVRSTAIGLLSRAKALDLWVKDQIGRRLHGRILWLLLPTCTKEIVAGEIAAIFGAASNLNPCLLLAMFEPSRLSFNEMKLKRYRK